MRSELRFLTNADVHIVDESDNKTEASLRDMSEHGLSIMSDKFLEVEPNSPYIIAIIPEEESNIERFKLEIESRWVKLNKSRMESGFTVIVPFDENGFKDYLEYLAQKGKVNNSTESTGERRKEPRPAPEEESLKEGDETELNP